MKTKQTLLKYVLISAWEDGQGLREEKGPSLSNDNSVLEFVLKFSDVGYNVNQNSAQWRYDADSKDMIRHALSIEVSTSFVAIITSGAYIIHMVLYTEGILYLFPILSSSLTYWFSDQELFTQS